MNGNGNPNLGPLTPYHPPDGAALKNFAVNRQGQMEVIWSPTYDYQTYPNAGATQFTFFQTPTGQGGTTLADTNMKTAASFPNPTQFLVTGIQVMWIPANDVARVIATTGVQANWQDALDVLFGDAWLELFIGSKPYLDDGPLAKFTQQFSLAGGGWNTGTPDAVNGVLAIDYAVARGRYYAITPVMLIANQNFNVNINFPTAVPLNVAVVTATIGVILDGFLYRLSQ